MDFNIFGGGGDRPPAPEMATPEDVEQYNLEFAREHGITDTGRTQTDPEEAPFAKAHGDTLGRNVKNRADFPWLYDPSRGVRWDFDPIQLRNLGQANTWVGMLVQSITKEIAETPWTITEANGAVETRKRLATHPEERDPISKADAPDELADATAERIYRLLSKPNPDLTWHDMVEQWMADLLEVGSMATVKAFHRSAYDGDELAADPETIEPRALQVTAPEVWTKDYHDRTGIVEGYWQFDDHHSPGSGSTDAPTSTSWGGTQPEFFDAAEMVWSDMSSRSNRRYGMPPTLLVEDFLQSIDLAVTQEQQYLSRGSIPSGAWVFEEWDRQQVKEWKEENAENVKGKPHKSLMFAGRGGDVKFEPMSMNFSELEFTERMKWYARVVASAFQVPTAVVGIEPERVNYNTFQGERQNFESNTLGPYLQKLERIINHDLIAPHWGEGYRFEFKPGMSESTRKMISERVNSEFSSGLIRRNEARKELGRPPVDDEFNGFQDEVVEDTAPDDEGALGDLALALDKATGAAVEFPNAGGPAFERRTTLIDFCDDLAEVCDGGVFVGENEYPDGMAGDLDGQPIRAVGVGERKAYAVWSRYRDEAVALSDPHTVDGASEIQQDSAGGSGNADRSVRKDEPLRESDDWHEFTVQPHMVEDLTEQIADDVRALFDRVLEDDEVIDIIDRLAADDADEETEKSLSSLGRRLREIFEDSDVVARIQSALRDETADAAREAIEDAVAETDEDPDVDIDAIESQLRDREVEFADKFADEMSEDIRETVGDGWAEGKGTREIADDIAEQADINEGWTGAERIARQELHIATGHARSEFAAEIDKVEIWNTSGDRRVRPAHEAMDGTWKRPGDNWEVDYSAEGRGVQKESVPGDSEPGIGCRCNVLLRDPDEVDRDDYAGDGSP